MNIPDPGYQTFAECDQAHREAEQSYVLNTLRLLLAFCLLGLVISGASLYGGSRGKVLTRDDVLAIDPPPGKKVLWKYVWAPKHGQASISYEYVDGTEELFHEGDRVPQEIRERIRRSPPS